MSTQTLVETIGRHQIHRVDGKYFLFTAGVGTWGFYIPTLDEARTQAQAVN